MNQTDQTPGEAEGAEDAHGAAATAGATDVDAAPAGGIRQARKLRTRQALLDAALRLLENQSLSSLGLREVTREVGIAPAAFYRHFTDTAQLGVALVEESFGSLHAMVREIRSRGGEVEELIGRSVGVIAEHVHGHPAHFRFLARERHGGVGAVRAAIAAELDGFVRDLVEDFTPQPESAGWSATELRMLAELYVNQTMLTATAILDAIADAGGTADPAAEQRILETARMQLRLISLGRLHWAEVRRATEVNGL